MICLNADLPNKNKYYKTICLKVRKTDYYIDLFGLRMNKSKKVYVAKHKMNKNKIYEIFQELSKSFLVCSE